MAQVVMYVSDEGAHGFLPAYSVSVTGGRALVRALRDEWAETARSLEQRLNGQDVPAFVQQIQTSPESQQTRLPLRGLPQLR
jgi:hypothetical protein